MGTDGDRAPELGAEVGLPEIHRVQDMLIPDTSQGQEVSHSRQVLRGGSKRLEIVW